MSNPIVSIIVLSFNQGSKTIKCFQSIKRNCHIPFEVIWVDNASLSNEFNYIQKNIPFERDQYKLIKHDTNIGFVKGVNSAISSIHPKAQYVVLLNNDTEIGPATFEKLIKPFKNKRVGVTSCLTQSQISWQSVDNLNKRWKTLRLPSYTGDVDAFTRQLEQRYTEKCIEVKNTNFAFFCAAFPRTLFVDFLKGLDQDFEIGLGEDDWACHKLRVAGFKFYLVLDAFVFHHHRTTFKALNIDVDSLRRKNIATLRKKVQDLNAGR